MSRLCNSSSEHSEGEEGGPGSFDVADFVGDNFERKGGGVDGLVVASDTVVGFDSSEHTRGKLAHPNWCRKGIIFSRSDAKIKF
jgi:hypothetical protein